MRNQKIKMHKLFSSPTLIHVREVNYMIDRVTITDTSCVSSFADTEVVFNTDGQRPQSKRICM